MKRSGAWIKRILYKCLPLKTYFSLLSKVYFISFRLGLLKGNRIYEYPYFMKNILSKGDVCIDIGANLGYLSTLFSSLVGSSGKVYAVEPVKPVLAVLKQNSRNRSNIEIMPYALGEENKTIQLANSMVRKKGFMTSGGHSILDAQEEEGIKFDAEMKKGSQVFGQMEKLDFIKCDVEGYEWIVLSELEPVISKHRPIILTETRGPNRKKLLDYFASLNFNNYILENGKLIPATPENYWDILTVPPEKEERLSGFIVSS